MTAITWEVVVIFLLGVVVGAVFASIHAIRKFKAKKYGDLCIVKDEDGEYVFLKAYVPIEDLKKTQAVSFEVYTIPDSRKIQPPL